MTNHTPQINGSPTIFFWGVTKFPSFDLSNFVVERYYIFHIVVVKGNSLDTQTPQVAKTLISISRPIVRKLRFGSLKFGETGKTKIQQSQSYTPWHIWRKVKTNGHYFCATIGIEYTITNSKTSFVTNSNYYY